VAPLKAIFWGSAGLLVYTHVGYGLTLAALRRARGEPTTTGAAGELPSVSVIVAAYAEQDVIADRVANLRALDYPADRLEVIVACDGSPDATAQRARDAGADVVLELTRRGKVRVQDAAVEGAGGEIVAFSDANVSWEPGALRELVAPFAQRDVGYVCGDVRFVNDRGTNQEGLYWRYEMALRKLESDVRSVTGGNGAIYATRRDSYVVVDAIMGHDLSFPFNMVKRGWRAVYAPTAHASEKMVPTIEGEFRRKRRMMSHGWPIMLRGGMLSPRGYDPLYGLMIVSHRVLRYASPFLHAAALIATIALLGQGWVYTAAFAAQVGLLVAALAAGVARWRPLLVARYYVLTTASLAAGLWDWMAQGTEVGWEPAEGTR
jgi:glycosyltransferase involved in cell wall biosynthesis